MRSGVALVALGSLVLGGCAARQARPASAPVASTAACPPLGPRSHWREMTWPEYYADVEQQAWRRGGRVIWIDPPRVAKVPAAQVVGPCAR